MSNVICAVMICAGQKMMLAQSVDSLFTPEVRGKKNNTRWRDTFGGKFV